VRGPSLVAFSVSHPRVVVFATAALTILSLLPLPRIRTDTNPKNMLPPTSEVRVGNAEVEKTFSLYEDMIVVGIRSDRGVLQPATLDKVRRITQAVMEIGSYLRTERPRRSTFRSRRARTGRPWRTRSV